MIKALTIKNVTIGEGRTKIAVSLMGRTKDEISTIHLTLFRLSHYCLIDKIRPVRGIMGSIEVINNYLE